MKNKWGELKAEVEGSISKLKHQVISLKEDERKAPRLSSIKRSGGALRIRFPQPRGSFVAGIFSALCPAWDNLGGNREQLTSR